MQQDAGNQARHVARDYDSQPQKTGGDLSTVKLPEAWNQKRKYGGYAEVLVVHQMAFVRENAGFCAIIARWGGWWALVIPKNLLKKLCKLLTPADKMRIIKAYKRQHHSNTGRKNDNRRNQN